MKLHNGLNNGMKIGVIADTHIPGRAKTLPAVVFKLFQRVGHIIHTGDIACVQVLEALEKIAPVTAVAGNVDPSFLKERLGEKKILKQDGFTIGICHGHGEKGQTLQRAIDCFRGDAVDCICYGHSHKPFCDYSGNTLFFNPGSPTDKRREVFFSIGILEIGQIIAPRIIYFDSTGIHTL